VVALIATIALFPASDALFVTFVCVVCVAVAAALIARFPRTSPDLSADPGCAALPAVGVGTVRTVADVGQSTVRRHERLVTTDVESMYGETFIGRLRHRADDPAMSLLRPGAVLLVAFDPTARERLSLADDMVAVRAAFDQMLIRKGLITSEHLHLIRHGTKSHAVVTGMRTTGAAREDYREVELDIIVSRPEGGQFPAHETALIPASSLTKVCPGSVIDTFYRQGDESVVAVCVPPS
jgi:hypothetical protein